MDVNKILSELKQEHDLLQHTIDTLEALARGRGKRRGRPPAWLKEAGARHNPKRPTKNRLHRTESARRIRKSRGSL